ncbi:MAG: sugar phosphate nucleotidyltransferase [Verrucomicrobiota bacterium]
MTKPTLLILAAGMGSRYGGLKQIDPVGPNGETIIDYSIYDALRAGFGKLVFVIRHDFEKAFKEIVGARFEKRVPVEYVYQELNMLPPGFSVPAGRTKPWGTTHAILLAEDAIKEPFAAINADDFYGRQAYQVLAEHLTAGTTDYAMVGFILRNTLSEFGSVARGVSRVDGNNCLTSIVEMLKIEPDGGGAKNTGADGKITRLTGDEAVSMNFWGFTPAVFEQLRTQFTAFLKKSGQEEKSECYIPATVGELVTTGQAKVKVLRTNDSWFGVTYREDRPRVVESVSKLIARGVYPQELQ